MSTDFILSSAELSFQRAFAAVGAQQSKHLFIALQLGAPIGNGFGVQRALILCAMALPNQTKWLQQGLYMLQNSIDVEILPDGGHVSRNPEIHLNAFIHLLGIRTALLSCTINPPTWL